MKVYKVGGAVRDKILGIKPIDNDWVVVGSSPEEMVSSGFKPIGKDFPVFLHPETNEEYALARTEKKDGYGYQGFNFYFGKDVSLEKDLSRRDLTINAIAEDQNGVLIDPYNGINDIENKIFRHVSSAFSEDPLRAIRVARFKSYKHLNEFNLASGTESALREIVESEEISKLSMDRLWSEIRRALENDHSSDFFRMLVDFKMHKYFLPSLKKTECISTKNEKIKWAELQQKNNFVLGGKLPIPNDFSTVTNTLRLVSKLDKNDEINELIELIQEINFIRNEVIIRELCELPALDISHSFIGDILTELKKIDFSVLKEIDADKINEEKNKMFHMALMKIL